MPSIGSLRLGSSRSGLCTWFWMTTLPFRQLSVIFPKKYVISKQFWFQCFWFIFCIDKYLASFLPHPLLPPSYAAPPEGRRASGLRCWRRGLATGGLAERASSVQWRSADVVEYKAEKSSPKQASRKTKKHDAHESWINWWEKSCSLILHC